MAMHVRHTLPRRYPVLNCDVEGRGVVNSFECALEGLHREEEVADFRWGEGRKVRFGAVRADEDVPWE